MSGLIEFLTERLDQEEQAWGGLTDLALFASYSHLARTMVRDIEAKRRMIDFIITQAGQVDGEWGDNCSDDELRDGKCSDHGGAVALDGLRILASIYADHPDCRSEWTVEQ